MAHVAIAIEGCGWIDQNNVPLMVANSPTSVRDRSRDGGANNASVTKDNLCHSF
ncbi:mitochondrial processing peptidase beta subunit [Culex quinquefasciatus]|uniref:Mitochondrial processing peptidase beta subunit n=1 Tax=Culex quinquefasciatus TaxID=7176 RepID=B0XC01_CULQU|nr:mitochondrial processing peptidase beta subunit [Culex quinquefasciatus]|eukprot:XP_001867173.1 mitochondrial processing peptidase beta subunit [Culex quinquefasciatus]